jgi:hypothetical protein
LGPLTFIWWVHMLGDCNFSKCVLSSNNIPRPPAGRLEMKIQYRILSWSHGPCENANCTAKERLGCFKTYRHGIFEQGVRGCSCSVR